jgi:signal peptidase I
MPFDSERLTQTLDRHLPTLPVRRGLVAALLGVALSFLVPVRPAITVGGSMEPTLHNGQPFLFSSLRSAEQPFKRGDVLVLRADGIPSVKRVAAVGGQVLWVIPRSDADPTPMWAVDPDEDVGAWNQRYPESPASRYVVPAGTVFVVGDSPRSRDSREYGPVKVSDIMGRVTWPPVPEDPDTWTFFHKLVPKRVAAQKRPIRIARR